MAAPTEFVPSAQTAPSKILVRTLNKEKRNRKIRDAFFTRYTNLPRPRKVGREYVVSELAEEFCLSPATVEDILYRGMK